MTDITIINVGTGQVTERQYTKAEKDLRAEIESNPPQEVIDVLSQNEISQNDEVISLKQSAIDKLKALGLTEEEAKALAGI